MNPANNQKVIVEARELIVSSCLDFELERRVDDEVYFPLKTTICWIIHCEVCEGLNPEEIN